jgi:hypothetical protein
MAFPPKKKTNIVGPGAIVRSLRKPKVKAPKACDCGPGESCASCSAASKMPC